jgi:hypothetical protein
MRLNAGGLAGIARAGSEPRPAVRGTMNLVPAPAAPPAQMS